MCMLMQIVRFLFSYYPPDELGAYVVFISTDYVFDGTKPPYKPGDPTCPLNKYGVSKADGEKVVLAASPGLSFLSHNSNRP